ncbi:MAG TPA: hypothetical protein VK196_13715 [Magnetospirillum sp.]|nr:hypothetical protein [Magnetospirillum sp.]
MMEELVRKVTPMMVLPDIRPVLKQYLALGFEPKPTDDPGCVGLRAGNTYLILVTAELMQKDFKRTTVAPLIGTTVPYLYVSSLHEAKSRLEGSAMVVEEAYTGSGTREAVVVQHGQFLILAEMLE